MKSLDVYAMTNPALGSVILWSFIQGCNAESSLGCDFAVSFLPLPIVLSSDLTDTFTGTNTRTGLIEWLDRHPDVRVGLANRVTNTRNFTRESLLFGVRHHLFTIDARGIVRPTSSQISNPSILIDPDIARLRRISKQLGSWIGKIDSTVLTLHSLGLTL